MAELKAVDPFVCEEEAIDVDPATAAAIECGIRDADNGRVVTSEEVRKRIREWISKSSTQNRP